MSKASTAALLSSTERMVQRQAWEMLVNENEMRYHTPGWQPGEPVWPMPTRELRRAWDGSQIPVWYTPTGERLHARPMIELRSGQDEIGYAMRCVSCEVSWHGDPECFVCGADTAYNDWEQRRPREA